MNIVKRINIDADDWVAISIVGALLASIATLVAAWVTHVVWVIKILAGSAGVTFGQLLLGFLGTFIPPVGIIHGFIIWFS